MDYKKYWRWYAGSVLAFALLLFGLYPNKPNFSAAQLQTIEGTFNYLGKTDRSSYGYYAIDQKIFDCPYAVRLYPLPSCPLTKEIKLLARTPVRGVWYAQKLLFTSTPILVEIDFNPQAYQDTPQMLSLAESQRWMQKLHTQQLQVYWYAVLMFSVLATLILLGLMVYTQKHLLLEKGQKKLKMLKDRQKDRANKKKLKK